MKMSRYDPAIVQCSAPGTPAETFSNGPNEPSNRKGNRLTPIENNKRSDITRIAEKHYDEYMNSNPEIRETSQFEVKFTELITLVVAERLNIHIVTEYQEINRRIEEMNSDLGNDLDDLGFLTSDVKDMIISIIMNAPNKKIIEELRERIPTFASSRQEKQRIIECTKKYNDELLELLTMKEESNMNELKTLQKDYTELRDLFAKINEGVFTTEQAYEKVKELSTEAYELCNKIFRT